MRIFFVCLAVIAATACTPRSVTPTITPAGDHGAKRTAEITDALTKSSYTSKGGDNWEAPQAVAHIVKDANSARVELIITRPLEGRVLCKVDSTGSRLVDDLKSLPNRSVHELITKYGCTP